MPAPDEALLKSLAGHHPLGETLGCMAGLFQMFEVHPTCIGRRYSSTRTGIDSGAKIESISFCESPLESVDTGMILGLLSF